MQYRCSGCVTCIFISFADLEPTELIVCVIDVSLSVYGQPFSNRCSYRFSQNLARMICVPVCKNYGTDFQNFVKFLGFKKNLNKQWRLTGISNCVHAIVSVTSHIWLLHMCMIVWGITDTASCNAMLRM